MNKSLLVKLALLLLAMSTLSGCFWRVEDEGYRRGDYHEGGYGDHHGEHHEHHDDRDDRGGYR